MTGGFERYSPSTIGTAFGRRLTNRGPRATGVTQVTIGVVCVALYAVIRAGVSRSYPLLVLAAGPLVLVGLFTALSNRKWVEGQTPTWWTVASVVLAVLGLGLAGLWVLANR